MRDQLPAWVAVQRLAPGFQLSGRMRLSDRDDWPAGEASVALELNVVQAPSGRLRLDGQLDGEAEVLCQRCLQGMTVQWRSAFQLELVDSEAQAQRVDSELDVYVAEDGRVQLRDLVRDESVLALPMTARHPEGACAPPGQTSIE